MLGKSLNGNGNLTSQSLSTPDTPTPIQAPTQDEGGGFLSRVSDTFKDVNLFSTIQEVTSPFEYKGFLGGNFNADINGNNLKENTYDMAKLYGNAILGFLGGLAQVPGFAYNSLKDLGGSLTLNAIDTYEKVTGKDLVGNPISMENRRVNEMEGGIPQAGDGGVPKEVSVWDTNLVVDGHTSDDLLVQGFGKGLGTFIKPVEGAIVNSVLNTLPKPARETAGGIIEWLGNTTQQLLKDGYGVHIDDESAQMFGMEIATKGGGELLGKGWKGLGNALEDAHNTKVENTALKNFGKENLMEDFNQKQMEGITLTGFGEEKPTPITIIDALQQAIRERVGGQGILTMADIERIAESHGVTPSEVERQIKPSLNDVEMFDSDLEGILPNSKIEADVVNDKKEIIGVNDNIGLKSYETSREVNVLDELKSHPRYDVIQSLLGYVGDKVLKVNREANARFENELQKVNTKIEEGTSTNWDGYSEIEKNNLLNKKSELESSIVKNVNYQNTTGGLKLIDTIHLYSNDIPTLIHELSHGMEKYIDLDTFNKIVDEYNSEKQNFKGEVKGDNYKFKNVSEYFAENLMEAINKKPLGKIGQLIEPIVSLIKKVIGMKNDKLFMDIMDKIRNSEFSKEIPNEYNSSKQGMLRERLGEGTSLDDLKEKLSPEEKSSNEKKSNLLKYNSERSFNALSEFLKGINDGDIKKTTKQKYEMLKDAEKSNKNNSIINQKYGYDIIYNSDGSFAVISLVDRFLNDYESVHSNYWSAQESINKSIYKDIANDLLGKSKAERGRILKQLNPKLKGLVDTEIIRLQSSNATMENNRSAKTTDIKGDKQLIYKQKLEQVASEGLEVKRIDVNDNGQELYFYKTKDGNEFHIPREEVEVFNSKNGMKIAVPDETTPVGKFTRKDELVAKVAEKNPNTPTSVIKGEVEKTEMKEKLAKEKRPKLEKAKKEVLAEVTKDGGVDLENASKVVDDVKATVEGTKTKKVNFAENIEEKVKDLEKPGKYKKAARDVMAKQILDEIKAYLKDRNVESKYELTPENFHKIITDLKEGVRYDWAWKKISLPKSLKEVLRKLDVSKEKISQLKGNKEALKTWAKEIKTDVLEYLRSNKDKFTPENYSRLYQEWGRRNLLLENYKGFNKYVKDFGEEVNRHLFRQEVKVIENKITEVLRNSKEKTPRYLSESILMVKRIGEIYKNFKKLGDLGTLKKLHETLDRVIEEGRTGENAIRTERINRVNEITREILKEGNIQTYRSTPLDYAPGENKVGSLENPANVRGLKNIFGQIRKFENFHTTIDRTIAKMFGGEESLGYKVFVRMTAAINSKIKLENGKWNTKFGGIMDEYFTQNKGITDTDLGIWALAQQSGGLEELLNVKNGVKDLATIKEIIARVQKSNGIENIKDFLWGKDGFNTLYGKRVAEKFKEFVPGRDLTLQERYLPFYKKGIGTDLLEEVLGDKVPTGISQGMVRERVGGGNVEMNLNFTEIVRRMMRENIQYVEKKTHAYQMAEILKKLSSGETTTADGVVVPTKISNDAIKTLRDYMEFDLSGGRDLSSGLPGYRVMNGVRSYLNKTLILYKASSAIKQFTGLLDGKALGSNVGFGIKQLFSDNVIPTEVSDWINHRLNEVIYMDDDLVRQFYYDEKGNIRKELNSGIKKTMDNYEKLGGYLIKKFDGVTAEATWVGFYKKFLDDNGITYNGEITAKNHNAYASEYADMMTKRVMGAMDTTSAPPILRSLFGKTLYSMGTVQLFRWNMLRNDLLPELVKGSIDGWKTKSFKPVADPLIHLGWFVAANIAEQTIQNAYTIMKASVLENAQERSQDQIYAQAIKQFESIPGFLDVACQAGLANYIPGLSTFKGGITYGGTGVAPIDVYAKILKQGAANFAKVQDATKVGDYTKAYYSILKMIEPAIPVGDLPTIYQIISDKANLPNEKKYKNSPEAQYYDMMFQYQKESDKALTGQ